MAWYYPFLVIELNHTNVFLCEHFWQDNTQYNRSNFLPQPSVFHTTNFHYLVVSIDLVNVVSDIKFLGLEEFSRYCSIATIVIMM